MKALNYLFLFLIAVAVGWVLQEYAQAQYNVPTHKVPIIEFNANPPAHLWTKSKDPTRLVPQHDHPFPKETTRFDHFVPDMPHWKGMFQSVSDKTPTTPLLDGTLPEDRANLISQALAIATSERNRKQRLQAARVHAILPDAETQRDYRESLLAITLSNKL